MHGLSISEKSRLTHPGENIESLLKSREQEEQIMSTPRHSAGTCLLNIISPNFEEVFKPGSLQNLVFLLEIKSSATILHSSTITSANE